MATVTEATIDDLYRVPENGKAELVNGEIIHLPCHGTMTSHAVLTIMISLKDVVKPTKRAAIASSNTAFVVDLPHRKSFSPDAAYYVGPNSGMKFFEGAPQFAVEVRSEGDYGPAAERAMAAKWADYFAAGTLVVWDVDLLGDDIVRAYAHTAPDAPRIFRRGESADAEPAVPGWSIPVDALLE